MCSSNKATCTLQDNVSHILFILPMFGDSFVNASDMDNMCGIMIVSPYHRSATSCCSHCTVEFISGM